MSFALLWVAPFLLLGIPVVIVLAGVATLVAQARFYRAAERATGVIAGYRQIKDDENGTMHRADIRFTANGREWVVPDVMAFGWRAFEPGQEVEIHYLPDRPTRAQVWRVWPLMAYLGCILAGGAVFYLGITRMH